MKAILVLDVPDEHKDKNLVIYQWGNELNLGYINKFGAFMEIRNLSMINERKYHYLELKPMPKEKEIGDMDEIIWDDDIYNLGYNKCLHDILGEENE